MSGDHLNPERQKLPVFKEDLARTVR